MCSHETCTYLLVDCKYGITHCISQSRSLQDIKSIDITRRRAETRQTTAALAEFSKVYIGDTFSASSWSYTIRFGDASLL